MDTILYRIFKNKKFDKKKLLNFGFTNKNNKYTYIQKIMQNQFELTITISSDKNIETKIIDTSTKDLYTLHLVDDASGEFVGQVREAYEQILEQIAEKCCNSTYFIYPQSNRIANFIKEKYENSPEFLWDKFPRFGVFRNSNSKKWYGLIANINKIKLDKKSNIEIEILNIKLDKNEVTDLQNTKGFYPAYHMNKKSWITIVLDETVQDKIIMELIDKSYKLSQN